MFIIAELVLAALVVVFITLLFSDLKPENKIAVILNDPGDGKWEPCIEGIKRCAKNSGISVVISNAADINNAQALKTLIDDLKKNGVNAIIMENVPRGDGETLIKAYAKEMPIAVLDEYNPEDSPISYVGPDNYEMGKALARSVIDDYAGNLEGKTVGIIARSYDLSSDAKRDEGFCEVLKESGAKVAWKFALDTEKDGMAGIKSYIADHKKVNVIVALDSTILESITEAAMAKKVHGALIYGVGNSEKAVYYLDHEHIVHMAVADGYSMGYDACNEVKSKLMNRSYRMQDKPVEFRMLTQNDLFLADNAEFLFTYE